MKSFERAKKQNERKKIAKLENSDTALQWGVFTAIVQLRKTRAKRKKKNPEKSMNKNGTESRTYFMLLSINSLYNPPHLPPTLPFKRWMYFCSFLFTCSTTIWAAFEWKRWVESMEKKTTHMPDTKEFKRDREFSSHSSSRFHPVPGQYFSIFCHFNSDSIYLCFIHYKNWKYRKIARQRDDSFQMEEGGWKEMRQWKN